MGGQDKTAHAEGVKGEVNLPLGVQRFGKVGGLEKRNGGTEE